MTTITTPRRTTDQRMTALAEANVIRSSRADLKRRLRHATPPTAAQMAATIIATPPRWTETMRLRDLLLCLPRCGPMTVTRVLSSRNIGQHKTLAGISPRQRDAALAFVSDYQQRRERST